MTSLPRLLRKRNQESRKEEKLCHSTELDVNMNAEEEEGGAFAQEVQDEFLPELISDDPLDDKDEADEEGDAEVKEYDAFIQQMEDQVKEFNRKTFD